MAKNKNLPTPSKAALVSDSSPISSGAAATIPFIYREQIAQQHTTSGPLPHPDILQKYELAMPGLADRIVKMAENESEHRRKVEAEMIAIQGREQIAYRRSEILGQIFGLAIGITAIVCATFAAIHGAQIAAAFIGTTGVTGLVTAFIVGRNMLLKAKRLDFDQQLAALREQRSKVVDESPGGLAKPK